MIRTILALMLACAFFATGLVAQQPMADAEPPPVLGPPRDGGSQLFRGLLHHFNIAPADFNARPDSKLIVIVLGDPGRQSNATARLVNRTLTVGGSVMIAADAYLNLKSYFPDGEDLEITGFPVSDRFGNGSYLDRVDYPFVVPKQLVEAPETEEELFQGLARIAANRPSTLRITKRPPYLRRTIGVYTNGVKYDDGRQLRANDSFAAAGVGTGRDTFRCLVMANAAAVTNDMLYSSADRDPTDNFAFAVRVVPWLQGPEKRVKCVFIENGAVAERFDEFDFSRVSQQPGQPPMPPPPGPKLPDPFNRKFQETASKVVSEVVTKVEDGDGYRKLFDDGGGKRNLYIAVLSVLFTAIILVISVYLRRRLYQSRQKRDYQPIPVDPLRIGDAALGSFTHRRLELLRGNDFRAPFAEFVRLLFLERGYPEAYAGDRCPRIDAEGKNKKFLIESIARLWDEAFAFPDQPLAYTQWKSLEPTLAAVQSAAVADRWRFSPRSAPRNDSEGAA